MSTYQVTPLLTLQKMEYNFSHQNMDVPIQVIKTSSTSQ
jgi:hypothetical protein